MRDRDPGHLHTWILRHIDTEFSAFNKGQDLKRLHILDAVDGVSPLSTKREDAAGPQDPEMLGDVGLFEVQLFPDVGHAAALLVEKLKDPDPRGVSQGLQIFS